MGKMGVDRRLNICYNAIKTAVKHNKSMFTATLGEKYGWTYTGNKGIKPVVFR